MAGRFALGGMLEPGFVCNILGINIDDGRSKGFLKVSPPEQYEEVTSADGLVVRIATGNRVYPTQLTLSSASLLWDKFSLLHAAGWAAQGGADIGPFLLKSGLTNLLGEQCYIKKMPEWTFGSVQDVTADLIVISDPAKMLFGGYAS